MGKATKTAVGNADVRIEERRVFSKEKTNGASVNRSAKSKPNTYKAHNTNISTAPTPSTTPMPVSPVSNVVVSAPPITSTPPNIPAASLCPVTYSPADMLVSRLRTYLPDIDGNLVRHAYAFAEEAHQGQWRHSGEPFITHPFEVANILLDLHMDDSTVAAALLHDVVEDTSVSLEDIEKTFSKEIAYLVNGVTKLSALEATSKEEAQAGTYRKMFIAMADDPRVVLIKLADRVHNMRTIHAMPLAKQHKIARETMEIYAPLAHRLGIWRIKSQLEDMSFKTINPEKHHEIESHLIRQRDTREEIIMHLIARLEQELEKERIQADITGRPKHIYSIYRKMERKGVGLDQIYDLLAVRVIVNEVSDCYRVLGLVHSLWTPVLSEFDDYIAVPKESMYRSLHTTVITPSGNPCEVQIRTYEMHSIAEHGIAAHWRYKEGFGRDDAGFEAKLAWLRGIIGWRREMTDAREFVESLKSDAFEEQVYVFTPKGQIIDLPLGSTPVDFAYRIHSEVGHRCAGAKVNGRMVALEYRLQSGEIVTIITAKGPRGPSRDWLNIVKTSNARSHIKRYFRRLKRDENITAGRNLMEKELKRLGLGEIAFDEISSIWGAPSVEELFAFIGSGETTARQVVHKVLDQRQGSHDDLTPIPQIAPTPRPESSSIRVCGTGNVLTRIARCCTPLPGEPIVGYVTRGKGVTIHRADCRMVLNMNNRERMVDVSWGDAEMKGYPVPITIESWDRVGLWRDITAAVANAGINIDQVQQVKNCANSHVTLSMQLTVNSINQLTEILDKLNRISNVIEARREGNGTQKHVA